MSVSISRLIHNTDYDSKFKELIDEYKDEVSILTEDLDIIDEFNDKVKALIRSDISVTTFRDTLVKNSFFLSSLITQLLQFDKYTPTNNNGLLQSNSVNCKFTLSSVRFKGEDKDTQLFIKVVDYFSQQLPKSSDLLIFDIAAAIIFELLLTLPENTKYRHLIPVYKGSFLSFTRANWNYNEIYYTNPLSPYNKDNIVSGGSPYYKNQSILLMTEAINNPISAGNILSKVYSSQTQQNIELLAHLISKAHELYDFIKYIGLKYGFMHNDLHMNNVIMDCLTGNLVMIDFGRASFYKYIKYNDEAVNSNIINDFLKLDYDLVIPSFKINDDSSRLYKNKNLFNYNISIGDDDNYFGIIYDLITYSLNIYIYMIYFVKNFTTEYQAFTTNFYKIIRVSFTDDNKLLSHKITITAPTLLSDLIDNFVSVKRYYIDVLTCEPTKKLYTMLLEGLLYTALLIHYKAVPNKTLEIWRNDILFKHFQVMIKRELDSFKRFIQRELRIYNAELASDDFLMTFIPTSGGSKSYTKTHTMTHTKTHTKTHSKSHTKQFSILDKYKFKKYPKLSLNETNEKYKEMYDFINKDQSSSIF